MSAGSTGRVIRALTGEDLAAPPPCAFGGKGGRCPHRAAFRLEFVRVRLGRPQTVRRACCGSHARSYAAEYCVQILGPEPAATPQARPA